MADAIGTARFGDRRIMISPLARRVARANGVDLASLRRSPGRRRIIHRDVLEALSARRGAAAVAVQAMPATQQSPDVHLVVECSVDALSSLCAEISAATSGASFQPRVSPSAFIAKAWTQALIQTEVASQSVGLRIRAFDLEGERASILVHASQCRLSEFQHALIGDQSDESQADMPEIWFIEVSNVEVGGETSVGRSLTAAIVPSFEDTAQNTGRLLRVQMRFATLTLAGALRTAGHFKQLVERPFALLA